jgi:hypothetical protein
MNSGYGKAATPLRFKRFLAVFAGRIHACHLANTSSYLTEGRLRDVLVLFSEPSEGEEKNSTLPRNGQGFLIAVAVGRQSCPNSGIGELIHQRVSSCRTQRLARRAEDRFIITPGRSEASAARLARGVDGDAVSGDWIENGHGQFSLVQAQGQRRACRFRSVAIGVVVTRQLLHWMLTSPKQTEAVHPRPGCFGGGG